MKGSEDTVNWYKVNVTRKYGIIRYHLHRAADASLGRPLMISIPQNDTLTSSVYTFWSSPGVQRGILKHHKLRLLP